MYYKLREEKVARRKRNFNIAIGVIAFATYGSMMFIEWETTGKKIFLEGTVLAFIVYMISDVNRY